jgi:hypothetical protein
MGLAGEPIASVPYCGSNGETASITLVTPGFNGAKTCCPAVGAHAAAEFPPPAARGIAHAHGFLLSTASSCSFDEVQGPSISGNRCFERPARPYAGIPGRAPRCRHIAAGRRQHDQRAKRPAQRVSSGCMTGADVVPGGQQVHRST